MTDQPESAATPSGPAAPASGPAERREQAQRVLVEVLRLMELEARVEGQDAPDGGIALAIHPQGEFPGMVDGRRSHVVDALQFLLNKVVNRPNQERRWVTLGVGGFRPPREMPKQPQALKQPQAPAARAPAPQQAQPPAPVAAQAAAIAPPAARAPAHAQAPAARVPGEPRGPRQGPPREQDEAQLEVPEDAALAQAARQLAEKSATLGRFYAIWPMRTEDRARVVKAASGIPGVQVRVEGEGRHRRVVFHPDKPAPMPKKALPDYGEDEE